MVYFLFIFFVVRSKVFFTEYNWMHHNFLLLSFETSKCVFFSVSIQQHVTQKHWRICVKMYLIIIIHNKWLIDWRCYLNIFFNSIVFFCYQRHKMVLWINIAGIFLVMLTFGLRNVNHVMMLVWWRPCPCSYLSQYISYTTMYKVDTTTTGTGCPTGYAVLQ